LWRLGIFGFPNVGKTTLFNAVTGLKAPTAPYPHSTTEPHLGVAEVPDPLLDRAADLEGSAKLVHASLELQDGLSLPHLREADALIGVLRAFEDQAVPADESGTDPRAQMEELTLTHCLADLDVVRARQQRVQKEPTTDSLKRQEDATLERAVAALDEGEPLRAQDWDEAERRSFRDLAPLTMKPVVWVVNVGEDQELAAPPAGSLVLSVRLEEEGSRLSPDDRAELFEGLGLGEGAAAMMVRAAYQALGLISFYTLNQREAHAWTVEEGATAWQAAGKVHSDLQRGFIRAEVTDIHSLLEAGGWSKAKQAGLVRVEGRDYMVREGDVILVRFSI
jgi:GTP-binding protein YchF